MIMGTSWSKSGNVGMVGAGSAPATQPAPSFSFAPLARVPPGSLSSSYSDLCDGQWPGPSQLPVVYHPDYNISFGGLEKLHPFDSCKFKKVVATLEQNGVLRRDQLVRPREATKEMLADVHTPDYLHKIHNHNFTIVQVTELPPLSMIPNAALQHFVIAPMRLHVGGTMLAAGLAMERGWAINLGGGMHHASADRGMGWCPFDDIALAVRRMRRATVASPSAAAAAAAPAAANAPAGPAAADAGGGSGGSGGRADGGAGPTALRGRVLVVDLDAHQGNGVARDKLQLPIEELYILDAYNELIFPRDDDAKAGIDIGLRLRPRTGDEEYLGRLEGALLHAANTLPAPDLVVYNAGTDVLDGDPLGRLGLSAAGVVARDEMVWRWCREQARAPVLMLLSGGYTRQSAGVIAASIANLFDKFGLADGGGAGVGGGGGGSGGGGVAAAEGAAQGASAL